MYVLKYFPTIPSFKTMKFFTYYNRDSFEENINLLYFSLGLLFISLLDIKFYQNCCILHIALGTIVVTLY